MEAILIFTLSFLGINFLVFLPNWIIGFFSKIDQASNSFFHGNPYFVLKKILYHRYSDDFFRLVFEIKVLTLLLLLGGIAYIPYFNLLIVLSFIYIAYIAVIIKIFKKEPMLYNDFNFAKTGFIVYKKKIPLIIIGVGLVLICVSVLGHSLLETLIASSEKIEQKWPLALVFFLSILISCYSIIKVPYELYHGSVSFSLIKHLLLNLKKGNTLRKSLQSLNENFPYKHIKNIQLKKQPNILFIFLESYGSFAFSNNEYSHDFKQRMIKFNESLIANEWKVASTLSESPVSSGGSWLSHSSILFGTKVKDIAAHEVIFKHTEYVSKLTSLPKYFESEGYKTAMTTTLSYSENEVDWEKVKNAYPFENLMLINDFEYTGKKVPIFGDRYSIPDEYTLNFAYNSMLNKSPFFLSVNTINSHYNYISPITPLEHWKDYNTKNFPLTDGLKKNNLKNYYLALQYQLDYIQKFFKNNKLNDTITVLIGDHQPPLITPSNIDKTTPIHVISKNDDFINAFKTFNFTEGLVPSEQSQNHEAFFSKFLYALNVAYGKDKNLELPIFEDGINLY